MVLYTYKSGLKCWSDENFSH